MRRIMQECDRDGRCEGDLACVCGVCTRGCEDDAACAELGEQARCMAVAVEEAACAGAGADERARAGEGTGALASAPAQACAVGCERDGECAELGAGFVCAEGVCREAASARAPAVFVSDPDAVEPPGGAIDGGCDDAACALAAQPLVLLLVDTSGSMERMSGCSCVTAGCLECLPDCAAGERNRWIEVIEALGGTLDGYGCESLERSEQNGATYDVGYFTPHFAPRGTSGDDGVLDVYRERLRFGLATFDGMDAYVGATGLVPSEDFDFEESADVHGLWSYNPMRALGVPLYTQQGGLVGEVDYPGCQNPYYIDTGVRGPDAEQGALMIARGRDSLTVNDRIQAELMVIRPFGGTPIAGSLDDLYYFLAFDPRAQDERTHPTRPHVVLITDGEPDVDYRNHGCDCNLEANPNDSQPCGGDPTDPRYDPARKRCPYPTAEQAARTLRCGHGHDCDGPTDGVHVLGYAVDEAPIRERLDRIAIQGGRGEGARMAAAKGELRAQLAAILDEIAAQ